jgi:pimeloyl-ACP methyl ester carboxylesterase
MLPGEQVILTHGDLEFTAWIHGEGPCVLFLHGFPDLPETWSAVTPVIAKAGFRTVTVTCRGYEVSSQPADHDYQLTSLTDDVIAWLDALGEDSAHIVGHDWGAAIAAASVAAHPTRFHSLTMVSVPHSGRFAELASRSPAQLWMSRYIVLFQIKGVAERRLQKHRSEYLEDLWKRWSPAWTAPQDLMTTIRERFQLLGVIDATLAYYRQGADNRSEAGKASRALASQTVPIPTLGIHGDRDGCVSDRLYRASMHEALFPAGVTIKTFEDCGHFPHLEKPSQFCDALAGWLVNVHAVNVEDTREVE